MSGSTGRCPIHSDCFDVCNCGMIADACFTSIIEAGQLDHAADADATRHGRDHKRLGGHDQRMATLSLSVLATIVCFTRAGVLDTLQKDVVLYERAIGFPALRLIWVFVLRNSVIAAITQIGLLFGGLIAGAVVVESIFDWPGIGSSTAEAILTSDNNVMMAITLVIGVVYTVINIAVDVVHGFIDPQLRESR